jgi:hypothetical protein
MPNVSHGYLQALHRYYCIMCKNPFPDENVHELRRKRTRIAELIAAWAA